MKFVILCMIACAVPAFAQESVKELRQRVHELRKEADALETKAKILEADPKIDKALSSLQAVPTKRERKLLIYSRTRGFRHRSIPMGIEVFKRVGASTGAFSVVATEDPEIMTDEKLAGFDGILMLSTTGHAIEKKHRVAFENFLKQGKGLIGIHAATDCHHDWPNYLEAMGGLFDGHPWGSGDLVTIFNEDITHSCAKSIPQGFQIKDEIYQYKDDEHFTREKLRILLSLDLNGPKMKKGGMKRKDNDYPVAWVRRYEDSRVFYSNFGHNDETFYNPAVLQHFLAGIQFALGDLEADTTPSAQLEK